MQKLFILTALALTLSTAALASTVNFTNNGGTLSGSNSGLTLSASILIAGSGLNGGNILTGNDLGGLNFTTGALTSSLQMGGMFGRGGSLTIAGNGSTGSMAVQGGIVQLTINNGAGLFNGGSTISTGDVSLATSIVPEPSSLSLMGIGLIGLAGLLRRKLKN